MTPYSDTCAVSGGSSDGPQQPDRLAGRRQMLGCTVATMVDPT